MSTPITLQQLLDALNYGTGENVQICHQVPGHTFTATVTPTGNAAPHLEQLPHDADVWYSVNPTRARRNDEGGRGQAGDVTRLAAIWADLDVKPGALTTFDQGRRIVDNISDMLGTWPTATTYSGHGLQPLWAVDDATLNTPADREHAATVLRRFGALVRRVAAAHGAEHVDSVFDLPRILRAPGTQNMKDAGDPKPVVTLPGQGRPLTLDEIVDALDAYSIDDPGDNGSIDGPLVSAPTDWEYSDTTCQYVKKMIRGWATETPTARHPWLTASFTRLAAAHRAGCITKADQQAAVRTLEDRFAALLTQPPARPVNPGEIRGAALWGQNLTARKTDEQVRAELGNHAHLTDVLRPQHLRKEEPPRMPDLTQRPAEAAAAHAEQNVAPIHKAPPSYTDTGNAEFVISRAPNHRYAPERGRWLHWTGKVWAPEPDDGRVYTHAKEQFLAIDEGDDKALAKHKIKSLSRTSLDAALAVVRRDDRMRIGADDLDQQPRQLNTPGGIVDLTTGTLGPHDREQWHTKMTRVAPDPTAPTPLWDRFLEVTFGADTELIAYMRRLFGYALTGEVTHHILPFLHGAGGNGKSVLMDTMAALAGDYATVAPAGFLQEGREQHETERARLAGMRLVVCSEVPPDSKFDEEKIKSLTGGDDITARFMRQDHFTFTPTHTLMIMGNHEPRVVGGGESLWRRLRKIPFDHTVPPEEQTPGLTKRLIEEEGPGILAWAVEGAAEQYRIGLAEPERVKLTTAEYKDEEDALGMFVDDHVHFGGGDMARVPTTQMRRVYESWCRDEGERPLSATVFGRELKRRFPIEQAKSNGRRYYTGLTLINLDDEEQSEAWETGF